MYSNLLKFVFKNFKNKTDAYAPIVHINQLINQ